MWLLLACAGAEKSTSIVSDDEFYDESNWGASEEPSETEASEDDGVNSIEYVLWNVEAELHLEGNLLNKDKSTIALNVFDDEQELLCSVVYMLEEALLTDPSFEQGLLWWRVLLKEADTSLQTQYCTTQDGLPLQIQIGVGSLHVESLAVWNDVDWGDLEPPVPEEALSAYVSLDGGDTVWIYGAAKTQHELNMETNNVLFLRPAYFFPF